MTGSGKLVLVTGANGFIATHVLQNLLQGGYHVRGVVRSQASADAVLETFPEYSGSLSVIVVPSMTIAGAFDQAVKDVDAVLHIASPFTLSVKDNETEMLAPAIKMTKGLLESVSMYGAEIKRVVITSSFAAMVDLTKGLWPGHTYTEADWNQITYDYAKTADAGTAYVASKALAEKAAWQFVQDRKPHFDITVLCPPMVFGPPAHPLSFSALNIAAWDINRFLSGELQDVPDTDFWGFVDVRDLAAAHVRALEVSEAGNERFLIAGGRYSYQQTADVLRASPRIPDAEKKKIPRGHPGDDYPGPNVYELDNSKSIRILGVEYRSFEESIVDSAVKVIEARRKAGI
ncbi:hypothetical protein BFJ68_g9500 [Fusarium oxysporum]|uniref:NAD-dependent epimerase/dehydratase domain-containing protein n=1 Tax=Fusarium oxysporum TaxID=5507 RepID=A0A420QTN1_FUSOX|nr:hypothetical protein BFJ68_g9500 [Fusarium oxysporum]